MRDNSDSRLSPNSRFVPLLLGPAVLSMALLGLSAERGEAGLIGGPPIKKTVTSFTSDGHRITVWRYEPKAKAKGKRPALIMLHGLECLSESPKHYEFIAQRFAAKGYAVHFIHYFNCTPVNPKEVMALQARIKASLLPLMPGTEPDERVRKCFKDWMTVIKGAVQFVRAQDNVDPERVGLIGFSLGGFLTMSLVATEPDLNVCVAVECFGGLPKELHGLLKNTPPVLIFHGDRDEIVPVKEAHTLRALLKERKCQVEDKIFENCGHMFLGDNGAIRLDRVLEAEKICVRFLEKHMKTKEKQK
jgi:dipeptidyl aminopeptidase/acylaminoacyl peptidase